MKHGRLLILTVLCFILLADSLQLQAQGITEQVYKNNIRAVRFSTGGDPLVMPIYRLNSGDRLLLSFDDMDGDVKNYYYTYELCDYNWQPAALSAFDYMTGFTQQQITSYKYSSIAYTHYTHYDIALPDPSALPTMSGNYILKIFLDGDTSQLVFTRRMLILENKATVAAQVVQPFSTQYARTHQRIRFTANVNGLDMFDAGQQIKVMVLQDNRWDNAIGNVQPTFIRGSQLNYDQEDEFVFPGGKEWRWIDLRSFRLQSDREERLNNSKDKTEIYVKPDVDRTTQRYFYYQDLNGEYTLQNLDGYDSTYQSDYATVHFNFTPPTPGPYPGQDLYIIGRLTDYQLSDNARLIFNPDKGNYELSMLLKQGYYSYRYMLVDKTDPSRRMELEGNHFDTENNYTILVYYKSFTDRNDRLIGIARIDSRYDAPVYKY